MQTVSHTFTTVRGHETVTIDIMSMDHVEAIDVYGLSPVSFAAGGYRVEGMVNGIPAGTQYIPHGLAYELEGDAMDALRRFLCGRSTEWTAAGLRAAGYRCRSETVTGQGYMGGDGITCYRVRRPDGTLAVSAISTHRTARAAWAEAVRMAQQAREAES